MPATSTEIDRLITAIQARATSDGSDIAKITIGDPAQDPLPELDYTVDGETTTVEGPFPQGQQILSGEMFAILASGIADYLVDKLVPIGTILPYNGVSIPAGWAVCDGTAGTPDLVDRFIRGANTAGGTGGGAAATDGPSDTTTFLAAVTGASTTVASDTHTHESSNLPAYYEVVYIIRQE